MKKNLLLIVIVIMLTVIPLFMHKGSEFGGADGAALDAISEVNSKYTPWVSNIWEPPGGETESLLFALQAAIGAGFIGYFVGITRARNKGKKEESRDHVTH